MKNIEGNVGTIEKTKQEIFSGNLKIKNIDEILSYTIDKYNSNNFGDENFEELLEIANDGFGIEMSLEDIKNHLIKSKEIFLLKINGRIVGFSSLANLGDFVYRFGTVIKKDFQGNGIYKKLSEVIYDENKKYFLRTQNKNVILALKEKFNNVLLGKEALDYLKKTLKEEEINNFMLSLGDNKKTLTTNGIFKGVYGGYLGDKDRINYINNDFISGFEAEKGDSLLVIYFNKK